LILDTWISGAFELVLLADRSLVSDALGDVRDDTRGRISCHGDPDTLPNA
jgi:hypothetical protein